MEQNGYLRQGGGVQLLPGQEPRVLRRRRGGNDRRRAGGEDDQDAARARAGAEVLPRPRGVQRAAARNPGGVPADQAAAPRQVERRTSGGGRTVPRAALEYPWGDRAVRTGDQPGDLP